MQRSMLASGYLLVFCLAEYSILSTSPSEDGRVFGSVQVVRFIIYMSIRQPGVQAGKHLVTAWLLSMLSVKHQSYMGSNDGLFGRVAVHDNSLKVLTTSIQQVPSSLLSGSITLDSKDVATRTLTRYEDLGLRKPSPVRG
jgi:hypothetical protein